jgi:hypothetical protein
MSSKLIKNKIAFTLLMGVCSLTTMNIQACGDYYESNRNHCGHGLNITGRAERTVKSDRAVLRLTISVSGDCYKELLQKLDNQVRELKHFWIKMGVKSNMIHVDNRPNIRISDLEYGSNKKSNKYSIQQTIVLTMNDLDMASDVQNKTNILVEKGFVFSNQNLEFTYSKTAELQKELTKEAMLDGQKTATENARILGLSIENTPSKIRTSNLGCVSTYDSPAPYERGWASSTNIENKFTVLVDMNYAFKKDDQKTEKAQESSEDDGAESQGSSQDDGAETDGQDDAQE